MPNNSSNIIGAFLARMAIIVFELLGLRGTRKILGEFGKRIVVKYSELVQAVDFSTTTTRALKCMKQLGMVEKKILAEPYRSVVYSLTEKNKRLAEIVKKLDAL